MKTQNKNFLLNVGYQLLIFLFPVITSSYTARILGAERLGTYGYVNAITTMFAMFSMLGIANYGNREVAKARDDKNKLSAVFSSIYTLQLMLSAGVFLVYILFFFVAPVQSKELFLLQSLYLVSVVFDVTWLFFGLEKFATPLFRNLAIKILSFLLVILFVKSENDLWIYTVIQGVTSIVCQGSLLLLSSREVRFRRVPMKAAMAHLKQCCILFVPVLAFSIYRVMDKTMIGLFCEKSQLAFYENAERIINIPVMIIGALGTVMMPHMAYTLNTDQSGFRETIRSSMNLACNIAAFSAVGLTVVARDIAVLLWGEAFLQSGKLIMALAYTVVASAWANVIRTQCLIPGGKDMVYVSSTIIGAMLNLICNLVFIPKWQALGACVGTMLAEVFIAVYQSVSTRRNLEMAVYFRNLGVCTAKALIMGVLIYYVGKPIGTVWVRISVQVLLALVVFVCVNWRWLIKDFFGYTGKVIEE